MTVTLVNKHNGHTYLVSIVEVAKRIRIPLKISGDMTLADLDLNDINMQAAIHPISFLKKNLISSLFSKPIVVINLDDGLKQISLEEFKTFLTTLLTEEKLDDILNKNVNLKVFEKYGYLATHLDIWSLYLFSKVRNIFIFREH